MSSSKKTKKPSAAEGGVAVLEPRPETSILSHIGAAASDLLLTSQTAAPPAPVVTPTAADSVWQRGQRITALWGKSEERNTWVSIRGVGWKKLSSASDSANLALTALASHAFQTGRTVDYREESDGMIHEIYVW